MKIASDANCCINCRFRNDTKSPYLIGCIIKKCECSIQFGCQLFRQKKKKNKYNAEKTTVDSITFDSKLEAKRYEELKLLQKCNKIKYFHRQVPFDLPGGIMYKADFQIFWSDGTVTYEDSKGVKTKEFIMKKKQVEAIYRIKIELKGKNYE